MIAALRTLATRAAGLVLGAVLALAATDAAAQRAFTSRFTANANGDILMIGNANMTCPTAAANCAAARAGGNFADNDFAMVDIDIDSDATTFNSSSADLNLPAGSTVLWAGLYWGANTGAAARNQVLLQRPFGFGYQVINASQVDTTGGTEYGAFADVTSIVQAGGSGTYMVANIQRTLGTNQWAGWSLIVAYQNNGETLKNLTVFDGFQLDPVTTTVSGFLTPLSGPITTRLGFVGYDGDRDDTSAGEAFTINGVPIVDGQNPALNFYNSTISNLGSPNTARNPSYDNTLGLDIDRVQAPAGALGNGATSATIQLGAANEQIWIHVVAFATDIYVPIITPNVVKTATDLNGGSLNRGDTIRYNITLSNTGQDTGTNVILTDPIPANTTYVPGSLVITAGANAGAKSDTAANDQAEFLTGPNRVVFRLGTGANGTNGGNIAFGQSTAVQFDVTVDAATPPGAQISNTATISYSGQTLGASFGTTSAAANATVLGPPTIAKSFSPNTIANGGTTVLTLVVSNPAANPSNLTGVTFSDTYPAGLVNTGAPSPNITCTAGSTPGTVNATAGGNSVTLTPGATIAPGGSCTITVNVTSSIDGIYSNTTSAVTSTNGGTGNTSGAVVLSVGKPRITKAIAPATILSGGTATVTLTLFNPTVLNLTGMAFSDNLAGMNVSGTPNASNTCGGTFTAPAGGSSVSLANGVLNSGATCTITFDVTSTTTGVQSNTTSGVTSTQTAPAGNPSNTVTLTVIGPPVITKSFSPTSTNVNVPSQMTITVTNPNPTTTITGVAFTDTYPDPDGGGAAAQMRNDTPSNRTFNCTAGSTGTVTGGLDNGTTVGLTGGSLAPGGSCTITVNAESSAITGTSLAYNNTTGTVTSTNAGTGAAANATLTVATLTPPTVTKAFAPANVAPGATSVMTITLTNPNGATAVTGVSFTDTYPAGLVNTGTPAGATTCPAGTVTAAANGSSVAFSGGTIAAGGNCTITVNVTSPLAGSRFNATGNIVTANAGTRTPGATATLNVLQPPEIEKAFAPTSVATNGDSTLTFTLTNFNNVALTGVGFTDTFPVGTSARGTPAATNTCGGTWLDTGGGAIGNGDAGVRLTGGTIPANGTCTLTVTVRGTAAGTYNNVSGAVTATGPIALTGNTASATLAVGQLGITKAFGTSPIAVNATSLLTFSITNSTGGARTGLAFTDTYPAGLVNASPLTVGGTCTGITHTAVAAGGTFNVTAANVAAGGCTITVLVTSATPGTYDNQTSGATYTGDPTPGAPSNVASLVVRQRPIAAKSFTPSAVTPGTASTLTITLTNNNGDAMTGVAFTDAFPAGMVVATPLTTTNTCGGTLLDSGGGALAANDVGISLSAGSVPANTTCTITVNVSSATPGTYNNTTSAITTTNASTGTAASATLVVAAPPTVAKSFAPSTVGLNGTSTLTITLTNPNGSVAVTGAAFTDVYPAGMVNDATPNASSSCGGSVSATGGGNSLALTGGTIPAGGNCAVTVTVTATAAGALLNSTGAVTTTNAGTGTSANGTLTVLNLLTVTKAFNAATVGVGQGSVLTITLTNPNTTAVTGAAFSDTYPANLVNTAAAGGATTCGGSPTVTAANNGTSVSLSGATVPASGSCTVTVNVLSNTAGTYNNTTGPVTTTNAGTAAAANGTLTVREVSLSKAFGAASINDGAATTLVYTFTNGAGNPAQSGIGFTVTLRSGLAINSATPALTYSAGCSGPANGAYVAGTRVLTLSGIALANTTASCTVTVAGVTNQPTQLNATCPAANFTNGAADIGGLTRLNTTGMADVCLVVNAVAPTVAKSFLANPINDGAVTSLVFTLTNQGTNPAQSGIAVGDTLPTSLRINTATPAVTYSAGCSGPATAAYNAGTRVLSGITGVAMTAGTTSCTITVAGLTNVATAVNASCAANPAAFTNLQTSITTTNATATGGNACLVVNTVAPGVAKTFGAGTINDNATTTLVFTLTNSGTNPSQSGIALGDTLPTGLRLTSATPAVSYSAGCSGPATAAYNTGTRVLSGLTGIAITAGTASCTVTVAGLTNTATQVNATCPAANFTNAAASVTTTNATNNSTDQCLVVTRVNPSVAKTFGAGTIADGAATTLVFTFTNSGSNPAQAGLAVGDTLPTGLAINSATPAVAYSAGCSGPATAAYNAGTRVLSGLTGIAMTAGTASCTATVSGLTNAATQVNATCPAANFTNASASVTTTGVTNASTDQCLVVTRANPNVAKTFGAGSINDNATTTLVFTLSNTGTNPAQSGITVGDTLPTGLRLNSATPAVAYSAGCSGPATAAYNAGTRVLSGLTGVAMTAGTASCTVTVAGLTNTATQVNPTCPSANFTNAAASVTTTGATNTSTDQCLVVNTVAPGVAKTFGAGSINDNATTTLVFTLTNSGSNPAQSGIALGDTLPSGLRLTSATPAVAYSAGCSGPATAAYNTGTRVLSGLTGIAMTAGTASCTVTVAGLTNAATQVNATCPAANFTNAAAAVTTTNATNNSTDQCLVVNRVNPSVAKTFGAGTIADGAATTLVFTFTNSGSNPAQSALTVGDTLPTGLAINSATPAVAYSAGCSGPATAAYNAGTRVLSGLTGIAMTAGTASCTATVSGLTNAATQVTATCPAANFTNASASVTTTGVTNASTDQCLVVTRANPNVAKTFGVASINDNATTTLVFTLTNTGTNPAQSGIAVGDTLPTGLRLNSATPAVAYSAGCSGPATAAYNAGTRVLSGLTGVAMAAGTASCTVTVAGLTNTATQTNASCVGNPAAFTNAAASVTTTGAGNTSTDQCLVVNTVAPGVAKTFGAGTIADGASTTLVFTLTNSGSNPAQSGIALGDTLPTSLRLTSATPAVAYSAGCSGPATAAYNAGTRVLSGLTGIAMTATTASCTVTVAGLTNALTQVNATCPSANFTNSAAAVTTTNATNNSTDQCVVVTRANPSVAKTFGAGTINDNATTTLVFTLTNSGTNPAQSGLAVGDTLPTGLRLTSATPAVAYSAGCSGPATGAYNAGTRVLSGITGVAMTAGTASCTITVAGLTNAASQTNTSCVGNPAAFTNAATSVTTTSVTNAATDQCLVVNPVAPGVAKTFGAGSINDNATTTLVFTLTNSGTNPAQSGIALGDTLPTGLRFTTTTPAVSYSAGCSGPATAAYNTGTRVLSGITGVAIAATTASCTVTVAGLTNTATQLNATCPAANFTNAAAAVTTTNATNNSTDQCLVVNRVNPSVAKTFGAGTIADGAATTLVFTLTNSGSNPAQSGIALGDTLPTGLAINSATPAVAYSAGCSGPATAAYNAGTRVLSGLTGIAMTATTASCTVTVSGLTNAATQVNATCPAANFTNAAAAVTTTGATNASTDQCLVVTRANPNVAKTFGAASINDNATTTLVFTLTNSGTNPAQSGIALGDTLPTGLRLNSATPAVAYSAGCSGPATAAYNAGTRVLSGLTGVAMAAGTASCTVTVAGLTNQATQSNTSCVGNPAAFTNTAAGVTTTNATNNSTDVCLVVNPTAPSAAKTFGAATIADTATTTLVFTLTNSGTNPAQSGIALGDTLPTALRLDSATPAVAYSAGCSGPATAAYNAGTRVLSGITGVAMTAGTASCTVTVAGLTNVASQTNASCAATPAAFTNAAASVTTTNATNTSTNQCLVVTAGTPTVAKTFGAASITDGAATTLVFTLTNSGSNPAQSGIAVGDTLPTGLAINSATPAVAYSAGCSGPATAAYNAGTRVLSGLTGIAMTATTASCTVTVSGLTNAATQVNPTCPAANFTNAAASVTTTGATNTSTDQCLVVNRVNPSVAKTFGAAAINDGAATTLVFTLTNSGTNPAQSGVTVGDTLPTGLAINSATPAVAYSAGCSGPATAAYNAGTRVLSGLTGLAMTAGTTSCTVTVSGVTNQAGQVNGSCAATPAAFTNAAASVTTTGATNTSIDRCLVVNTVAPSAAKTFGAAAIADGGTTTLVFTLTNTGTNPAQAGIALGDTLPASLRINSATPAVAYSAGCSGPATGAYNAGTRVLSGLTGIAIANGTASCTVTVAGVTNVAAATNPSCVASPAAFTNAAASVTTTNATNTSVDRCLVVTAGTPTVAKTFGAGTFADGGTTTLVFTLTNGGTSPAQSGIAVGDTLPTGLQLSSATPAVTYSAGCSGPANGAYNAGTRVLSGITGVAMTAGTASCTITVAGLTNQAGQVNASCVGNPAAFTNASASVTSTNATNASTDQCVVVTAGTPTVAKTFGTGTIADGAATTLVFTFTNTGTNPPRTGLAVGDTLPTGLAINSATPAVTYSAGCSGPATAAYNAGTRVLSGLTGIAIANGTASCSVTVAGLTNAATQVNATCPAANFTNTSAAVTATGATNTSTDQCLVVTRANPSVAKTFGAGTIADGAATTLVFTLTNSGTNPAQSGITLGDTLPTGLQLSSATPAVTYSAGCSGPAAAAYNAGTRVLSGLTGVAMTAGTASCTVTVAGLTNQSGQVNGSCAGNPAAFTNTSAGVTTTGATNTSTDQCLVVTAGTPTVAKTFAAGTIADGATTSLVFTFTNTGTNPARAGLAVGDTLPTGLAINSATPAVTYSAGCSGPATAAYNAGTRVLSGLTGIAIANGTASCSVTVAGLTNAATQTNASCAGNPAAFTNASAAVTSTGATNTSTDQCLVVTAGTPGVAKTFGTNTIADGATTTLVFTLTNTGTNPARSGIVVGDTLPTGLAINSATPAVAYSAGCSGPATAAYNAGTRALSGLTGIAMTATTASCTVTVAGLTNAAGQVNATCPSANFTNLAANVTATNATPGGTDQCMVVTAGTPTVAKTFGTGTIADGAATTLVFTFTNTGTNPPRTGLAVGDTLPTGLAINSATPAVTYSAGCSGPATAAYNAGTRVLSGLTGLAIANGTASCSVTVSGLTNAATQTNATCPSANFTNLVANVTATGATPAGTDPCMVVTAGTPTVAKTFGAGTFADGAATTLVFTLTNTGTNPARAGISVGDTLPSGLQLSSATPAVAYSAGCSGPATGAYNAGTRVLSGITGVAMTAGTASCTITVAGLTNQAGQVNATCPSANFTNLAANVTATNATPAGTDQCVVVTAGTPSVAKTFGAAAITDGAATSLVFTFTNTGTNPPRTGLAVGDTLPTGLAINSATPALTYSAGCSGPANGAYNAGTRVLSGVTGIAIANGTASCSVTVAGVTNQATQVNASCVGNPAAFTNASAAVTSTGATNTSTDQCLVVNRVNPSVAKTFGAGTIADAGTTTLVFTLTNTGTNPAQAAISLGDTLPTSLRLTSATPAVAYSAGCSGPATGAYNAGTRVLSGLTGIAMAAGTASCTVTVAGVTNVASQVNASCAGNPAAFTNAAASVTATNATNASTDQCLVVTAGTVTIAKTFGAAAITDGTTTTLVFTLTNGGTSPAQSGIAIGDTLPSGLRLNSATPAVAYSAGCSGPATAAYNAGTGVLSGLTGIAVTAGTASCTVTVAGLTNTAGQVNATCPAANFTNLAANVTVTNATVGGGNACLVVNRVNPVLSKAFTPSTIDAGGTSTLVFTLANQGTNPAQSGINFTDTLPAGVVVAGTPNVQSNCPAGGALANNPAFVTTGANSITVTGAAMGAAVATCEVRVNVTAAANGSYTNNAANVTGTANVDTTGLTATLTVQTLPVLTKAFSTPTVAIGGTSTLVFTISNTAAGSVNRTGLAFTDTLTARIAIANPAAPTTNGNCGAPAFTAVDNTQPFTASGIAVNAGQTCVITLTIRGVATGVAPNATADVATTGLVNNVGNQSITVNAAAPTLQKTFTPATIASGGTSTLTVRIDNPNAAAITVTSATDTFPAGLVRSGTPAPSTTCAGGVVSGGAGTLVLTGGTVPANGFCTFQVNVTAATQGSYVNTIQATDVTTSVGNAAANASATLTVTPVANVAIAKSGPATIGSGATITYTLVISNAGPDAANAATFADTVPAAVPGVTAGCGSPTGGAACGAVNVAGNSVTGSVTTLPAGGSVTITIQGTVVGAGGISNTATVAAPGGVTDPDNTNNSSTAATTILAPDLTLAKTHAGNFTVGVNGTYTLTVSNPGTLATSGTVTVTDTLPAGLGFVSGTGTGWTCGAAGQVVTCTSNAPVAAGGTGNAITLTVSVASIAVPSVLNTATVSGGGEPPVNTNNNLASDNTIVVRAALNTFAPDNAQTSAPGTVVFYPHVFNAGLAGTVGFSTTNLTTPAVGGWSNEIFRDTNCNGVLDGAEGVAPMTGTVAVNAGDPVCIVVKDSIPVTAPYNGRNVISVTATFNGTQTITRTDTTTVGAAAGAGLTLQKSVRNVTQGGAVGTTGTARPNDVLEYTIVYTNTSAGPVSSIVVTDATPAFTTFLSAACVTPLPASLTACNVTSQPAVNGAGSVVWTLTGPLLSNGSGSVTYQVRVAP